MSDSRLTIVPLPLDEANAYVEQHHRHSNPVVGHKFSLGVIDETGERYVRMANLACVGSHAVNGVAELHSKLLQETTLHDFFELWPHKLRGKTS